MLLKKIIPIQFQTMHLLLIPIIGAILMEMKRIFMTDGIEKR